jgi:hypothetical protein
MRQSFSMKKTDQHASLLTELVLRLSPDGERLSQEIWSGASQNGDAQERARILRLLEETIASPREIRKYLDFPNPSFGGKTARSLLRKKNFALVEADLRSLQDGVYS